jgi:hypothetical protein
MSVTRIQITAIFAEYRLLHARCEIKDLCRSFIRAREKFDERVAERNFIDT